MTRTRGVTEQAADAAIDTACRMLRLPTAVTSKPRLRPGPARAGVRVRVDA